MLLFILIKECFTRVLKGHIALARAVFPNKTTGNLLAKQYQSQYFCSV